MDSFFLKVQDILALLAFFHFNLHEPAINLVKSVFSAPKTQLPLA